MIQVARQIFKVKSVDQVNEADIEQTYTKFRKAIGWKK